MLTSTPNPSNRPVGWIYNDNAADRARNHLESANSRNQHWEGFAPTVPGEDLRYKAPRRDIIQNWHLGPRVLADATRGIFWTAVDCPGTLPNYLSARQGAFVRVVPNPPIPVPANCGYM